jgi:hypothetical protein
MTEGSIERLLLHLRALRAHLPADGALIMTHACAHLSHGSAACAVADACAACCRKAAPALTPAHELCDESAFIDVGSGYGKARTSTQTHARTHDTSAHACLRKS